jgi:hypothetical protein
MKTTKTVFGIALALTFSLAATLKAQDIYVTVDGNGGGNAVIGEYTTSGATVNAALISGLGYPGAPSVDGVAISGNDLFAANYYGGGAGAGFVGEYTTSGATVNASLISGLSDPQGLAISGNDLFVTSGDTIGEYTLSGAVVNASLITGLSSPQDIAICGDDLFVVNNGGGGYIGEYTTSGARVNASLISGLGAGTCGIAISPVPEPSAAALAGLGAAVLWLCHRRK